MRGSKDDIPVATEAMGVVIRLQDWGSMTVAVQSFPAGIDNAPVLKGLPDDRCQCPHWGYVIKGRARVQYKDRAEILSAGDAYYLPPGHSVLFEEASEVVDFSPGLEYHQTLEVIAQNIAAMQAAGAFSTIS